MRVSHPSSDIYGSQAHILISGTVFPTLREKTRHNHARALSLLASMSLGFLLLGLPALSGVGGESLTGFRAPLAAGLAVLCQAILWLSGGAKLPSRIALALLLLVLQVVIFTAGVFTRADQTEYGLWKLQGFCLFGLFPTAAVAVNYASNPVRIKQLLIGFFVMALTPILVFIPTGSPALFDPSRTAYQLYLVGANPIPISRSLGAAALLTVLFAMEGNTLRRLACAAVILALVIAQFAVGERGPILALFVALVIIPKSPQARIRFVVFLLFSGLIIAAFVGLNRPNSKFTVQAVESDGRLDIMTSALQAFIDHPLIGVGMGTFYSPTGTREYFHNLEGELATETGIVGLAAFIGFLAVLWGCRDRERTPQRSCTLAFAVFWLVNAQVSGDIVSNSMCWVTTMLWACSQFPVHRPRPMLLHKLSEIGTPEYPAVL